MTGRSQTTNQDVIPGTAFSQRSHRKLAAVVYDEETRGYTSPCGKLLKLRKADGYQGRFQ